MDYLRISKTEFDVKFEFNISEKNQCSSSLIDNNVNICCEFNLL